MTSFTSSLFDLFIEQIFVDSLSVGATGSNSLPRAVGG